jgi:hypothetical protein
VVLQSGPEESMNKQNGLVTFNLVLGMPEKDMSVLVFKNLSFLLQQVRAHVDTKFVLQIALFVLDLVKFLQDDSGRTDERKARQMLRSLMTKPRIASAKREMQLFFENMTIHPVEARATLHLSQSEFPE